MSYHHPPPHDVDPHDNDKIHSLEKKIKTLSSNLESLSDTSDMRELIRIIRFPGWTTPAEWILVNGVLDSIQGQVNSLKESRKVLLAGSKAVQISSASPEG